MCTLSLLDSVTPLEKTNNCIEFSQILTARKTTCDGTYLLL